MSGHASHSLLGCMLNTEYICVMHSSGRANGSTQPAGTFAYSHAFHALIIPLSRASFPTNYKEHARLCFSRCALLHAVLLEQRHLRKQAQEATYARVQHQHLLA